MKDALKRKLRSNRGVTLLLSLLVFLVCVVAGSVVLTAGTASSGTLSERAKLDQRYFSVTSAAELLRGKFDGQSVSVKVTSDASGNLTSDSTPPVGDSREAEFAIAQSLYLLDKFVNTADDPKIQWKPAYSDIIEREKANRTSSEPPEYTLKLNTDDPKIKDPEKLKVTVIVKFTPSGLIFQLENDNGDNEKFRLQMEYSAVILEEASADETTYHITWQIGTISYAN